MQDQRQFFNDLAATWDQRCSVGEKRFRRVVDELNVQENQWILDVGSGTGVLVPYLLERDSRRTCTIHAIDYAEQMITVMKQKNFCSSVVASVMDIHSTSFADEAFDRIVANSCYPHFCDKAAAMGEIHRILKPAGLFVLAHPTGRHWVNNRHKQHDTVKDDILPEAAQLQATIEPAGFKCLKSVDEDDFYLLKFIKT